MATRHPHAARFRPPTAGLAALCVLLTSCVMPKADPPLPPPGSFRNAPADAKAAGVKPAGVAAGTLVPVADGPRRSGSPAALAAASVRPVEPPPPIKPVAAVPTREAAVAPGTLVKLTPAAPTAAPEVVTPVVVVAAPLPPVPPPPPRVAAADPDLPFTPAAPSNFAAPPPVNPVKAAAAVAPKPVAPVKPVVAAATPQPAAPPRREPAVAPRSDATASRPLPLPPRQPMGGRPARAASSAVPIGLKVPTEGEVDTLLAAGLEASPEPTPVAVTPTAPPPPKVRPKPPVPAPAARPVAVRPTPPGDTPPVLLRVPAPKPAAPPAVTPVKHAVVIPVAPVEPAAPPAAPPRPPRPEPADATPRAETTPEVRPATPAAEVPVQRPDAEGNRPPTSVSSRPALQADVVAPKVTEVPAPKVVTPAPKADDVPAPKVAEVAAPKADDAVVVGGISFPLPPDAGKPASPPPAPVAPKKADAPATTAGPFVSAPTTPPAELPTGITIPVVDLPPVPAAASVAVPAAAVVAPALAQGPAPLPFPTALPPAPGGIEVNGVPLPYDALSQMVEGHLGGFSPGCAACGAGCPPGRQCSPGTAKCEPFPANHAPGRMLGLIYENLCCPDPCYQPKWDALTDTGFFTNAPRPVSQTILRWDYAERLQLPDRGEFFFARSDGNGRGPKSLVAGRGIPAVDVHELGVVTEVALGNFSTTIAYPYRSVNPGDFANSAAGFGDLQIATKSLLFDSELFLLSFQLRTTVPTGSPGKGLGTGHVSLEPSAIAGIRFGPKTFGVAQLGEWIPLGADPGFGGALLRYNFSMNHVLWQPVKAVRLIGTMELQGYSFQDGAYTDPFGGGPVKLSGQSFLSAGPGARLFYCDKFDMGVGTAFGITGRYFAKDQLRLEVRYRF